MVTKQPSNNAETWSYLVRKTRRKPLLYGIPKIKLSFGRTEFVLSPIRFLYAGILIAFGTITLVFIIYGEQLHWSAPFISYPVGTFFIIGGLAILAETKKVFWNHCGSKIHIHYGSFINCKEFIFSSNEIRAELYLVSENNNSFVSGQTILALRRHAADSTQIINIACSEDKAKLVPAFHQLNSLPQGVGQA